jgi:hypothetical protein
MASFNCAVLVLIQLLCLPLGLAAQTKAQVTQPGTATVSGQIRLNGEPLPSIKLVLRPERMTTPASRDAVRETQSDENGNYRITGLSAGAYALSLLGDEFIMTGAVFLVSGARGKRLNLLEGEQLEHADLELKRGGVITGRVTDAGGRPLVRERIELTKLNDDGKPQDAPFNQLSLSLTDEHGVYRLHGLSEGRYLFSVGTSSETGPGRQPANSSAYAKTFYPGVTDQAQARAIEVKPGAQITGVDIPAVEAKRTYAIRGRVVSAENGEPVAGAEIIYGVLIASLSRVSGWRPSPERSNEAGEFQLKGLVAGKYGVYARALPERELFSDPVVLEIVAGGIERVELKLGQGGALSGVAIIEDTNDPAILAKLSEIQLVCNSSAELPILQPREPARVNADGSFLLKGLQSGKVKLGLVVPVAGGWFRIKRVERDGVLQRDDIELRPGEQITNVRVVLGYAGVTLRGEVKVIGGTLPANLGLSVNAHRIHEGVPSGSNAYVDARGQFVLEQLMPGEYEVRVISLILQPGEPRDQQLLKLIAGAKQKVTLSNDSQPRITFVIDLAQKGNQ